MPILGRRSKPLQAAKPKFVNPDLNTRSGFFNNPRCLERPKILQAVPFEYLLARNISSMQARLLNLETALISPRTVIRRFREGEGAAFYRLVRNNYSRLEDHFPTLVSEIQSKDAGEVYVQQRLADWLLQRTYAFGLWDGKSADLIGWIQLFEIDWRIPKCRLQFFIDREAEQQGIMSEAVVRVLQFGFTQLALEKVSLKVLADNYPAQRLARRCGFHREGDLRAEFRGRGGKILDGLQFAFTRSEYDKV